MTNYRELSFDNQALQRLTGGLAILDCGRTRVKGYFFDYKIFELFLFQKILSSNLIFRIRQIIRNCEKRYEHNKKSFMFCSNFFSLFVSNQRKTLFKMAFFNFSRRWPHIFISYLKNHMTFFWDIWSKLFGNIFKIFLISC